MSIQISLINILSNEPFFSKITSILKRQIEERCGTPIEITKSAKLTISFEIQSDLGEDGFKIDSTNQNTFSIKGQNLRGILYGLGKFLHTSQFDHGNFYPSQWKGNSIPDCSLRAIYFAMHFHNFYHEAPIERIEAYLEDLVLWGYNALITIFDTHHFTGITTPEAQSFLTRVKTIFQCAKELDLQVGTGIIANEGYSNSPKELRADQTFPGTRHIRGGYGVEICPSKPGGTELLMKCFQEEFEAYGDIKLDYLMVWPYDQGGCCCESCRPWGANGYLKLIPQIKFLALRYFPNIKIVLSTWLFDPNGINEGEWDGLSQKLSDHPNWVNYILADAHTTFPEYPIKHGSPGSFPLVNFPEISMWNMGPWGGYGANPLPTRFQVFWNVIKEHISGGIPYSEGIFEDINKVIWSQFYWQKNRNVEEILKEYCQYEFPSCDYEKFIETIKILEANHHLFKLRKVPKNKFKDAGSRKAFEFFSQMQENLPDYIKDAWRWQILYLRSLIDFERIQGKYFPNPKVQMAFNKLREIYYAKNAESPVRPPIIRFSWIQKYLFSN